MSIEVILSSKGKEKLINENFIYNYEKTLVNQTQYWRCEQRRKLYCHGSVKTIKVNGNYKIISCEEHNHLASPEQVLKQTFNLELKKAAKETSLPPSRIHQELYSKLTKDEAFYVNNYNAARQVIKNARKDLVPREPQNVHEFEVPDMFSSFLLTDVSDIKENRVIIFCQPNHAKLLCESETVLMDGTFSIVSKLFYQLYTIHGLVSRINNETMPLVYCLMTSKSSDAYRLLFTTLKSVFKEKYDYEFDPTSFLIDFEIAAINIIKEVCPEIKPCV